MEPHTDRDPQEGQEPALPEVLGPPADPGLIPSPGNGGEELAEIEPEDEAEPAEPAARRLAALLTLLGDDSPAVSEVAREELKRAGEEVLPGLRRAARSEHAATRARARALVHEIERARARRRLLQYLADGPIELEPALFLMARLERPDLDARPYKKALDAFAESVRRRIEKSPGTSPPLALAEVLGGEIGFSGGTVDYHHPDRIYLHRVIETRSGLPLTLTAIYILVARRLGIRAAALPIPGHVVLRVYGPEGPILLDPFHGGEVRTRQECEDYLARNGLAAQPSWFHDASDALLVQRQLMNLMQSHRLRGFRREAREAYRLAAFVERQRKRRT
jgi:regulator of sirC expression with transglutaminase-like and TPR domain